MNFTELEFWPRLVASLALILVGRLLVRSSEAARSRYDRIALSCLNLTLLLSVGVLTTSIFVTVFLTTWVLLQIIFRAKERNRSRVLWIGIPLLCSPLIYYKYSGFLMAEIAGIRDPGLLMLAIPAGISFYTFQKVALLVDACRAKDWRPKFIDCLNFASFFPQVVAGPIERKAALFPQMERFSFSFSWERLDSGAPWVITGLFYKLCLADNLTSYIDRDSMDSAWPVLISTFLFGFKIYFDFCGYSLIALGLAKFLGVDLMLNFRSPYWSGNIRDFWRRWHISLSYWLRDYVYFPIGGSRTRFWAINLLVVFVVSGIWHGAGWGFLIWGALHGTFSIVSHALKDKIRLPWLLAWPLTISCVFLAWLPFYENRMEYLCRKAAILIDPGAYTFHALQQYLGGNDAGGLIGMGASLGLSLVVIGAEGITRWRRMEDYSFARHPIAIAIITGLLVLLGARESNDFIYFSF